MRPGAEAVRNEHRIGDRAPGTIARVYRELEAEGLVVSRVRHDTVVSAVPEHHLADPTTAVAAAARTYASASRRLNLSLDEAIAALGEQWAQLGD